MTRKTKRSSGNYNIPLETTENDPHCLICYCEVPWESEENLSSCIQNFFFLRHVMDIPEGQLRYYLRTGAAPQSWITLCDKCSSNFLENGLELWKELKQAERLFTTFKKRTKEAICGSVRRNRPRDDNPSFSITDEARLVVFNGRNSVYDDNKNPFLEGDRLAMNLLNRSNAKERAMPSADSDPENEPDRVTFNVQVKFEDDESEEMDVSDEFLNPDNLRPGEESCSENEEETAGKKGWDLTADWNTLSCRKCSKVFPTREELQSHVLNVVCLKTTPLRVWACDKCPKVYQLERNFNMHKTSCTGYSQGSTAVQEVEDILDPTCSKCNFTFKYPGQLVQHLEKDECVELMNAPKCKTCGRSFRNLSTVQQHKCGTAHKCDLCTFRTTRAAVLENHLLTCHEDCISGKVILHCPRCPRKFITTKLFETHKFQCRGLPRAIRGEGGKTRVQKWQCDKCDKSFAKESYLEDHTFDDHGGKYNTCNDCGFRTKYLKVFLNHAKWHERAGDDPEKTKCHMCNAHLSGVDEVKVHLVSVHDPANDKTQKQAGHNPTELHTGIDQDLQQELSDLINYGECGASSMLPN